MIEQLQHRANTIKDLIRSNPERGAELLSDFAERYGTNTDLADEVLLIQFELRSAPALDEAQQAALSRQLEQLADKVVAQYDEDKVNARLAAEQEVIEAAKQRRRQEGLVAVAEGIVRTYPRSKFRLEAEKLELRLGEITGLVGENATGKTTFLRILAGDLAPTTGQVRYPLFDPRHKLAWNTLKLKIAYVPQELPAWEGPLRQNLHFEAARHGILGAANHHQVEYIIQRLGLAMYLDRSWHELSGGYKLRFALAKALVWQPQLLILDEPLAFLDIKTQMSVLMDIQALAKSLRDPISVLVSSQHLHEIEAIADQMLFMRDGHLENLGLVEDLGKDRHHNLFELGCALPFKQLEATLKDLPYHKVWTNGITYYIAAPTAVSASQLLAYLLEKDVAIEHFRNISTSVKTKFYEDLY